MKELILSLGWHGIAASLGVFLVLAGTAGRWAWRNWRVVWYDCTTDFKTGHYVQKDVLRFLSGLGAVAYFLLVYPLVMVAFHVEVSTLPGLFLAGMASLLNWQKIQQTADLDRRTKDPQGGALTIPADQAAPDQTAPLPLQRQAEPDPSPARPQADPNN